MRKKKCIYNNATLFYLNLQQFVLENVFPHDEIDEEIYMKVLLDFGGSLDKNKA